MGFWSHAFRLHLFKSFGTKSLSLIHFKATFFQKALLWLPDGLLRFRLLIPALIVFFFFLVVKRRKIVLLFLLLRWHLRPAEGLLMEKRFIPLPRLKVSFMLLVFIFLYVSTCLRLSWKVRKELNRYCFFEKGMLPGLLPSFRWDELEGFCC
jgi:hypothetical protein